MKHRTFIFFVINTLKVLKNNKNKNLPTKIRIPN